MNTDKLIELAGAAIEDVGWDWSIEFDGESESWAVFAPVVTELLEVEPERFPIAEYIDKPIAAFIAAANPQVVKELCLRVKALEKGVKAISNLIDESQGVYGLHLNGDPSPWKELLAGGFFEDWLRDLSAAMEQNQ